MMNKLFCVSLLALMACDPPPPPRDWSVPIAKDWAASLGFKDAPVNCVEFYSGLYLPYAECSVRISDRVYNIARYSHNRVCIQKTSE